MSSREEEEAPTGGSEERETADEGSEALAFLRELARVPEVEPLGGALTHLGDGGDPERFTLGKKLGEGGFGVVYEAIDRARGATVALKVMRRRDGQALSLFKREFRALGEIAHPHLVQLYELHGHEGRWFFTMELIRGAGVLDHLRAAEGDERERRLRAALRQLAGGLCFLHEAGKLHRDVKPSNVMVDERGAVKLLDFGLIVDLGGDALEARHAGTPGYMAPEQIEGGAIGPAADWFAVGVLLHEALVGRRPASLPAASLRAIDRAIPADLDRLCIELLAPDPARRPDGAEVMERLAEGARSRAARLRAGFHVARPASSAPFVGREAELRRLGEALAAAKSGRPAVALVRGSSGIGKSALVQRFLESAEDRGEVVALGGRCYQQESMPYKALDGLVDALGQRLGKASPEALCALLPPDAATLGRLFPVLQRLPAIGEEASPGEPLDLRRRAFQALRALLGTMAGERTPALFIDDLQWGDLDSVALLTELLRPPGAPALLLVATYRAEEAETSPVLRALFEALQGELRGGVEAHPIAVDALDPADAESLSRALLSASAEEDPGAAAAVAAESRGNPFFLTELARWAGEHDRARPALSGLLDARVDRLPEAAQRLLTVIALSGPPLPRAAAARAARLEGDDAEPHALGVLRAAQLVRVQEAGDRQELLAYHDRIREAVAARLSPPARREQHLRLALALEAMALGEPSLLVAHFREAGRTAEAAGHAVRAADLAREALAFDQAARFYREALDLGAPDPRSLRIRRADALAGAGRPRDAAQAFLEIAAEEPPAAALPYRREAMTCLLTGGYVDEGVAVLQQVLAEVGQELPPSRPSALFTTLALRARLLLRGLDFRERSAREIPEAELLAVDACWAAASSLGLVEPPRAAALHARHLLLALECGEPFRVARALSVELLLRVLFRGGAEVTRSADLLARTTALAEQSRHPEVAAVTRFAAGIAAHMTGDLRRAEPILRASVAELHRHRALVAGPLELAHSSLSLCLWMRGELPELSALVARLLDEARERGNRYRETMVGLTSAFLLDLAADRPEAARATVDTAMRRWSRAGYHLQHLRELLARVRIALYMGDGRAALRAMAAGWPRLLASGLLAAPVLRLDVLYWRATATLAAAREGGLGRAALLTFARRDARALARRDAAFGAGFADWILARVAFLEGRPAEAARLAASVERTMDQLGMSILVFVARRRRGEWIGGAEGRSLVGEADAWMEARGIKSPERLTAMIAG